MNRTGLGGVTQPGFTLEVGGDGRFNTDLGVSRNLTISGILQSPLTSLISVSASVIDAKLGVLGISNSVIRWKSRDSRSF